MRLAFDFGSSTPEVTSLPSNFQRASRTGYLYDIQPSDVRVFISGIEVPVPSISVSYSLMAPSSGMSKTDPLGHMDIELENPDDLFIITEQNMLGKFSQQEVDLGKDAVIGLKLLSGINLRPGDPIFGPLDPVVVFVLYDGYWHFLFSGLIFDYTFRKSYGQVSSIKFTVYDITRQLSYGMFPSNPALVKESKKMFFLIRAQRELLSPFKNPLSFSNNILEALEYVFFRKIDTSLSKFASKRFDETIAGKSADFGVIRNTAMTDVVEIDGNRVTDGDVAYVVGGKWVHSLHYREDKLIDSGTEEELRTYAWLKPANFRLFLHRLRKYGVNPTSTQIALFGDRVALWKFYSERLTRAFELTLTVEKITEFSKLYGSFDYVEAKIVPNEALKHLSEWHEPSGLADVYVPKSCSDVCADSGTVVVRVPTDTLARLKGYLGSDVKDSCIVGRFPTIDGTLAWVCLNRNAKVLTELGQQLVVDFGKCRDLITTLVSLIYTSSQSGVAPKGENISTVLSSAGIRFIGGDAFPSEGKYLLKPGLSLGLAKTVWIFEPNDEGSDKKFIFVSQYFDITPEYLFKGCMKKEPKASSLALPIWYLVEVEPGYEAAKVRLVDLKEGKPQEVELLASQIQKVSWFKVNMPAVFGDRTVHIFIADGKKYYGSDIPDFFIPVAQKIEGYGIDLGEYLDTLAEVSSDSEETNFNYVTNELLVINGLQPKLTSDQVNLFSTAHSLWGSFLDILQTDSKTLIKALSVLDDSSSSLGSLRNEALSIMEKLPSTPIEKIREIVVGNPIASISLYKYGDSYIPASPRLIIVLPEDFMTTTPIDLSVKDNYQLTFGQYSSLMQILGELLANYDLAMWSTPMGDIVIEPIAIFFDPIVFDPTVADSFQFYLLYDEVVFEPESGTALHGKGLKPLWRFRPDVGLPWVLDVKEISHAFSYANLPGGIELHGSMVAPYNMEEASNQLAEVFKRFPISMAGIGLPFYANYFNGVALEYLQYIPLTGNITLPYGSWEKSKSGKQKTVDVKNLCLITPVEIEFFRILSEDLSNPKRKVSELTDLYKSLYRSLVSAFIDADKIESRFELLSQMDWTKLPSTYKEQVREASSDYSFALYVNFDYICRSIAGLDCNSETSNNELYEACAERILDYFNSRFGFNATTLDELNISVYQFFSVADEHRGRTILAELGYYNEETDIISKIFTTNVVGVYRPWVTNAGAAKAVGKFLEKRLFLDAHSVTISDVFFHPGLLLLNRPRYLPYDDVLALEHNVSMSVRVGSPLTMRINVRYPRRNVLFSYILNNSPLPSIAKQVYKSVRALTGVSDDASMIVRIPDCTLSENQLESVPCVATDLKKLFDLQVDKEVDNDIMNQPVIVLNYDKNSVLVMKIGDELKTAYKIILEEVQDGGS